MDAPPTKYLTLLILSMLGAAAVPAQQSPPSFQATTNQVLVPVVVRDAKGGLVASLKKEDFRLFDNGKEQAITSFSLEEASGRVAEDRGQSPVKSADAAPMVMPEHYVALMFDDVHIGDYGDLTYTRNAVRKYLDKLQPEDRVAFFTVSGFTNVDFTSDRSKIVDAMMKLGTGPSGVFTMDAKRLAITTIIECDKIVSRMALLPGRRTLVILSSGLIIHTPAWTEVPRTMRMVDHAIRSRVVINTMDTLGLSTISPIKRNWEFQLDISDGTGGKFIRDTNDMDGAVEQLAATPKYRYVLGFSPGNIKPDGSAHRLTVKLREGLRLDVQARSGYSAPGAQELTEKSGGHSVTANADAPRYSEAESKEVAKALDVAPPAPASPAVAPPFGLTSPRPANDEMVTTEQPVRFKVQTNLVDVPVIVRDQSGHAIGNLKQEDFRIFDKGKRQEIARFAVVADGAAAQAQPARPANAPAAGARSVSKPVAASETASPTHFITFVFDDLHMITEDIPQVRGAALKYLRTQLRPGDRVSLVTTSGRESVDFTGDPEALATPMNRIMPSPLAEKSLSGCGAYVSYFQAVQVDREVGLHPTGGDVAKSLALRVAVQEYGNFESAVMAIRDAYTSGLAESRNTLAALRAVVRRMVSMSGQRTVVLVSPGFFIPFDLQNESDDLMAEAIRSKVLVSVVDARGVWANPGFDACRKSASAGIARFRDLEGQANREELIALAEDTGGSLNVNNDFLGGIEKAAAAPEYRYILGFVPQDLKLDGSFHALKVTVAPGERLNLQARRGYWAPKHPEDEAAISKQEIQDAVFSRDETHGLAAEMHTRVTKAGDQAKLSVLTSLDLKAISLRKADGRNRNDVTIVAAIFDTNGNFLEGTQKLVELRLFDQTVAGLPQKPPVTISTDFDVKPGAYLVRLVVRDAEERQITAENAGVRVP